MDPAKIDLWHPSFIFFQNAFSFWIPRNLTICSCGPKQPWVWCDIGWPFSPASASSCRFRMMCHGSLLKFIVYHGFTIDFTTENNWEYASQLISITLSPESYWSGCGVSVCPWFATEMTWLWLQRIASFCEAGFCSLELVVCMELGANGCLYGTGCTLCQIHCCLMSGRCSISQNMGDRDAQCWSIVK